MTSEVQPPYVDEAARVLVNQAPLPRRALFLDRDGIINVDRGYVHTSGATDWVDGIFTLVADAREAGFLPIVITNQAGIARGLYDVEAFLEYTTWVHAVFRERGVPLLATYYCPHHPTAGGGLWTRPCTCRKPGAAMIERAVQDWSLDLGASILVGDKPTDVEAGRNAGVGRSFQLGAGRLPAFARLSRS